MTERDVGRSDNAIRIALWWFVGVALPVLLVAVFVGIVMMADHM